MCVYVFVMYGHNSYTQGRLGVCRPPPAPLYVPLIPKTVLCATTRTIFVLFGLYDALQYTYLLTYCYAISRRCTLHLLFVTLSNQITSKLVYHLVLFINRLSITKHQIIINWWKLKKIVNKTIVTSAVNNSQNWSLNSNTKGLVLFAESKQHLINKLIVLENQIVEIKFQRYLSLIYICFALSNEYLIFKLMHL